LETIEVADLAIPAYAGILPPVFGPIDWSLGK
jgi:hypothetical protein